MPLRMNLSSRFPLVGLLIVSAALELGLNRVGVHLVSAEDSSSLLYRFVDRGGLFVFYLTGLLALAVFSWAVVVQLRDRHLLDLPGRMAVTVTAALFLPLAAVGLFVRLPNLLAPHLNSSFLLLILALVLAVMRRPVPTRAKIGLVYFALPLLLHGYWLLTQQLVAVAPTGRFADLPARLFEAGEHLVVVGAFASFLFYAPFPRRQAFFEPIPMAVALLATGGLAVATQYFYAPTAQAAYYGLSINLPPPSLQGGIHLVAFFFFVLTIGTLLPVPGASRTTAQGLLLLGLSGFHLQLPHQLLLTQVALLLLVRGALDGQGASSTVREGIRPLAPPTAEAWKTFFRRLSTDIGASQPPEVVLLSNEGTQVARLRTESEGLPVTLRLLSRGTEVLELELNVGQVPRLPATTTLLRRRGRRGRRVPDGAGPRLPVFDPQFVLRGGAGQGADHLSGEELREPLRRWVHGLLGVWPAEGVQYVARPAADSWPVPLGEVAFSAEDASTDELRALCELLCTVARRAGVRAGA
ncbi:MAG: hypothetical protein IT371_27220 [Deltaproteobacteria bacterium]|nr:hypothetical protein [Deltaproteobacteria bacterium]